MSDNNQDLGEYLRSLPRLLPSNSMTGSDGSTFFNASSNPNGRPDVSGVNKRPRGIETAAPAPEDRSTRPVETAEVDYREIIPESIRKEFESLFLDALRKRFKAREEVEALRIRNTRGDVPASLCTRVKVSLPPSMKQFHDGAQEGFREAQLKALSLVLEAKEQLLAGYEREVTSLKTLASFSTRIVTKLTENGSCEFISPEKIYTACAPFHDYLLIKAGKLQFHLSEVAKKDKDKKERFEKEKLEAETAPTNEIIAKIVERKVNKAIQDFIKGAGKTPQHQNKGKKSQPGKGKGKKSNPNPPSSTPKQKGKGKGGIPNPNSKQGAGKGKGKGKGKKNQNQGKGKGKGGGNSIRA